MTLRGLEAWLPDDFRERHGGFTRRVFEQPIAEEHKPVARNIDELLNEFAEPSEGTTKEQLAAARDALKGALPDLFKRPSLEFRMAELERHNNELEADLQNARKQIDSAREQGRRWYQVALALRDYVLANR